eukprot:294115-Pelagomonas_calceolata.AAC.5
MVVNSKHPSQLLGQQFDQQLPEARTVRSEQSLGQSWTRKACTLHFRKRSKKAAPVPEAYSHQSLLAALRHTKLLPFVLRCSNSILGVVRSRQPRQRDSSGEDPMLRVMADFPGPLGPSTSKDAVRI